MNDTTSTPPSDTQAPRRGLASLADVIRSRDDRVVAGVAGGMAQRFNIDPILIRVLFVVLCFAGLAGLILYAAAWLFLPSEGELRSNVAEWFGLEEREQQVRDIGLATAGLLAFFAVVGDSGWGWGGGWVFWVALWVVLPIAFVTWILRRRRAGADPYSSWEQNTAADSAAEPATMSTEPQSDAPFASAAEGADTAVLPEAPSEPGSPNEPPTQQSR